MSTTNATNTNGTYTQSDPTSPTAPVNETDSKVNAVVDKLTTTTIVFAGVSIITAPVTAPFQGALIIGAVAFKYFWG